MGENQIKDLAYYEMAAKTEGKKRPKSPNPMSYNPVGIVDQFYLAFGREKNETLRRTFVLGRQLC